jgi:hypothetical protein
MSELTKALCDFHKEVGTINKDAKAQYGAFADLAGVLSTVQPPLARNGLTINQTFMPSEGFDPILVTILRHVSGETIESHLPMVVNKGRNALHDWGASCTYLRRYALLSMLCLVADVDTDGAFVEPPKQSEPKPEASATKRKQPEQAAATSTKTGTPQQPNSAPLTPDTRQMVIDLLISESKKDGGKERVQRLSADFLAHFELKGKLSDHLTTEAHVAFINDWLKPD